MGKKISPDPDRSSIHSGNQLAPLMCPVKRVTHKLTRHRLRIWPCRQGGQGPSG